MEGHSELGFNCMSSTGSADKDSSAKYFKNLSQTIKWSILEDMTRQTVI